MSVLADIDASKRLSNGCAILGTAVKFFLFSWFAASFLFAGFALAAKNAGEAADALVAFDIRVAGDDVRTRIVMEFEQKPEFSHHLLAAPYRLVVDLPETVFGFNDQAAKARGLLSDVRFGAMGPGRSRIVFTSVSPVKVVMADVMKSESDSTYRLVVDLAAIPDAEFAELISSQEWDVNALKDDQDDQPAPEGDAAGFTVVIDPGHGGIDTGAKGQGGAQEKDITLAMAFILRDLLAKETGFNVVLTRHGDNFVSLSERVRRARLNEADMFVSLHADSLRVRNVRGATVYTLSEQASDQLANQKAEQENRSDLIAGLSLDEEPDLVADILFDLTRRETELFSDNLAMAVIQAFDGEVKLIKNPVRSAGFRVLRAPDVPSVLVELGFLSNAEDEKLLIDPKWRQRTAELLVLAIRAYRDKVTGVSN